MEGTLFTFPQERDSYNVIICVFYFKNLCSTNNMHLVELEVADNGITHNPK